MAGLAYVPVCGELSGIREVVRNIAKANPCFPIAEQLKSRFGKHLSVPAAGPGGRNVLAMLYDGDVVVGTEVGYTEAPEHPLIVPRVGKAPEHEFIHGGSTPATRQEGGMEVVCT